MSPSNRLWPAHYCLLIRIVTAVLPIGLCHTALADETRIEAVDADERAAEIKSSGHFSLLADGHSDEIFEVNGPSGSTINNYLLVLADGNFLAPIEREEEDLEGDDYDRNFLFNRSIHGDCFHSDAKFFRKIVDGKVAGFYAIQSIAQLDTDNEDILGYDDFRNATIVFELFRFERRKSKPEWHYPRFRKVAEKRIIVQECEEAEIRDDIIQMIRSY